MSQARPFRLSTSFFSNSLLFNLSFAMSEIDWSLLEFIDFPSLPTLLAEEELVLDVGTIDELSLDDEPEFLQDLRKPTITASYAEPLQEQQQKTAESDEIYLLDSFSSLPSQERSTVVRAIVVDSASLPQVSELNEAKSASFKSVRSIPTNLTPESLSNKQDVEYLEHHDRILKSLSPDQLRAVSAAYQLVRWTNDLQLGYSSWLEKNQDATQPQIRAVKTLLNPAHWKHTWPIVTAADEIVRKLINAPGLNKKRSRTGSIDPVGKRRLSQATER